MSVRGAEGDARSRPITDRLTVTFSALESSRHMANPDPTRTAPVQQERKGWILVALGAASLLLVAIMLLLHGPFSRNRAVMTFLVFGLGGLGTAGGQMIGAARTAKKKARERRPPLVGSP